MSRITRAEKGHVYLVGAGPGDPELLTLRALRLLETADVIFHDDLVPDEVLALAHRHALITSVGKRCGRPRITQAEIHTLMIDSALAGQSVVRLKSGDPLVFGRAGEEIAALQSAQIPLEVVPGVTAAFAAGAVLALPLTDRKRASKLILCTGHHAAEKQSTAPLWSGPLPDDATLAIYMPGRDTVRIAAELAATGLATDIPCCAISHAATPRQSHAMARLSELPALVCGPAPLLLLVGRALEPLFHAENKTVDEVLNLIDRAMELHEES
ncbi:uroporphyrinogen-III C-methyltransferase [Granulicella sp. 5B5]|uniref:uroporphyrinogen-III C-methyltransferase n=1 Tax=Granulicella sp. 5B5 TaxID=1617967 RepID=UPI0015F65F11|nr:uroporphyrinogen-III C-methyltransferase [Granulicella sp. 5B5]QMV20073.1 uroporphyrinogen-III C-methyltransferase [Granulicella sp. 5B5]